MKRSIAPLPYAKHALEPHISARTVDLHYEQHHKGYLAKLEKLVAGKPEAEMSLVDLIRTTRGELGAASDVENAPAITPTVPKNFNNAANPESPDRANLNRPNPDLHNVRKAEPKKEH